MNSTKTNISWKTAWYDEPLKKTRDVSSAKTDTHSLIHHVTLNYIIHYFGLLHWDRLGTEFQLFGLYVCRYTHAPRNVLHPERFGHRQRRVENNLPNFVYKVRGRVKSGTWLRSFRRNLLPPYLWYDVFVNWNWVDTRWQQYSTHLHTNNTQTDTKQTIHRTIQQFRKSAGRAPSWLVISWHLPYNRGKSKEKPQSG
jgi:hypothetical protein